MRKFQLLLSLMLIFSLTSFGQLTESFSGGPGSESVYTGEYTFSSGYTWDLSNVKSEYDEEYNPGFGTAAIRYQSNSNAYIITPSINTCGTITFQYRKLNITDDAGTITISKSVNNSSFTQITTQAFNSTTYTEFSYVVNDESDNIKIKIATNSNGYLLVDEVNITSTVPSTDPTLISTETSLTGFEYVDSSGPSLVKTFELSGTNLDGTDVTISATNYEFLVASDKFAYSNSVTLSSFSGSKTINVRLKAGLAVADYNETITISGGGDLTDLIINVSGEVTEIPVPTLVTSTSTITNLNYVETNGPSSTQSFLVSGTDLDLTDVTITAPSNFEISQSTTFTDNLTLTAFDGTETTINLRLKTNLIIDDYTGSITIAGGGAASSVNVSCSGSVTAALAPEINSSLTASGTVGTAFSYTITAENLPTSFTATGLPSGLSITGAVISGTPVDDAVTDVTISAISNNGTDTKTLVITIIPMPAEPNVFISEIACYGMVSGTWNNEYIELSNTGSTLELDGWQVLYYEDGSLEETITFESSHSILSNGAFVIAARSTNTINEDYLADFSFNHSTCYVVLKDDSGTIIDQAGSASDEFDTDNNYSFTNCGGDNGATSNWDNLLETDGTPGVSNCLTSSTSWSDSKSDNLVIYPNPNNGSFTIGLDKEISSISVFDITGKTVYNNINTINKKLNLDIETGIYFVEVITESERIIKKFIVK